MATTLEASHARRTAFAILALAARLVPESLPCTLKRHPLKQHTVACQLGCLSRNRTPWYRNTAKSCHDDAYMNGGISFQHFDRCQGRSGRRCHDARQATDRSHRSGRQA